MLFLRPGAIRLKPVPISVHFVLASVLAIGFYVYLRSFPLLSEDGAYNYMSLLQRLELAAPVLAALWFQSDPRLGPARSLLSDPVRPLQLAAAAGAVRPRDGGELCHCFPADDGASCDRLLDRHLRLRGGRVSTSSDRGAYDKLLEYDFVDLPGDKSRRNRRITRVFIIAPRQRCCRFSRASMYGE